MTAAVWYVLPLVSYADIISKEVIIGGQYVKGKNSSAGRDRKHRGI